MIYSYSFQWKGNNQAGAKRALKMQVYCAISPCEPELSKPPQKQASPASPGVTFQDVDSNHAGQRLDNYLLSRLKGVPKSRIYRIIRKGEVRVNRKREKPEYKLQAGDRVRIPPVRTAPPREQIPPSASLREALEASILYQDEGMLVLNKPAGLPVHGGTGVKIGLIEALRHMYPALTGLELVHRLDKGTSGCLMLAKTAKILKNLSSQFKCGEVGKHYHALVEGAWPDEVTEVSASLEKQSPRGGERRVEVSASGKSAQTGFCILESFAQGTLVQASPITGRTHQIRVHTQLAGHPVIGDEKYQEAGARKYFSELGVRRLCLHSAELSFNHPVSGERMRFAADRDEPFEAAIRVLRQAGD